MVSDKDLKYGNKFEKKSADHLRMRYERRIKRLKREKEDKANKFTKQIEKFKPSNYISAIKSMPKQKITQ